MVMIVAPQIVLPDPTTTTTSHNLQVLFQCHSNWRTDDSWQYSSKAPLPETSTDWTTSHSNWYGKRRNGFSSAVRPLPQEKKDWPQFRWFLLGPTDTETGWKVKKKWPEDHDTRSMTNYHTKLGHQKVWFLCPPTKKGRKEEEIYQLSLLKLSRVA